MLNSEPFDHFYSEGFITEVVRPVRSGKEASVWLCRANPSTGHEYVAVKAYHPPEKRNFHNRSTYKSGVVIGNARNRRAVAKRSAWGRTVDDMLWQGREWEHLETLHAAGADVPRPITSASNAILMEHIGDVQESAPQLRKAILTQAEARETYERLLWNIELMLSVNVIHGDLSPFNILWWEGRATIIDMPQAVDPRTNRNAEDLLARDVSNVCKHFDRYGIDSEPDEITRGLWTGFLFADLM